MTEASAPLAPRDAYRLWADEYQETAVSALEARVVASLTPPLAGRALLDAACGTGRRLPTLAAGTRRTVGVDLSPEMLRAGRRRAPSPLPLVAGDLRALPIRSGCFDLLWCRLAIGHVPQLPEVYRELARVAVPGATLIVSDFHPAATAAGHLRTFRDPWGATRSVEHFPHSAADHERAAAAGAWSVVRILDAVPGPEERPFYERADRLGQLERERDLPLVLAICLTR